MKTQYPAVIISDEGAKWLKKGQMWMYRNNLEKKDDQIKNGDIVQIMTNQNEYLGTGFFSEKSHISVRILSKDKQAMIDQDFFKKRIQFAYDYRKTVEAMNLTNCRFIFGEADELPGLIVDRYNDILVTQISTYGMDCIKDTLYAILLDVFKADGQHISGIYERNDIHVRQKEGLPMEKGFWKGAQCPTRTIINENGLKLHVDVENGQKTGYFLDQKRNRLWIREISKGKKVLDCFTHTGGFALNAALGQAQTVSAVDVSQTALNEAYQNAILNHLEDRIQWIKADVFDYLEQCQFAQYDLVILDPPAFTKSRRTVDHAYQGYKTINLQAMRLLPHGGYLATCSCSRFMEIPLFETMLKEAACEAGVTLRQVEVSQQNVDHPILWTMEETSYLKFYVFQIFRSSSDRREI